MARECPSLNPPLPATNSTTCLPSILPHSLCNTPACLSTVLAPPQGLKSEQILPESKILAVAYVVEAMSSHRPYRPSLGIEAALEEITHNSSSKYDSTVVDTCVKVFTEKAFAFSPA